MTRPDPTWTRPQMNHCASSSTCWPNRSWGTYFLSPETVPQAVWLGQAEASTCPTSPHLCCPPLQERMSKGLEGPEQRGGRGPEPQPQPSPAWKPPLCHGEVPRSGSVLRARRAALSEPRESCEVGAPSLPLRR